MIVKAPDTTAWRGEMAQFRENTEKFYAGEIDKGAYKGYSGRYGSYAQKGAQASMLRLRMTAGRVTKAKLAFIAEMIQRYDVQRAHFTTCQAIQLHDLNTDQVCSIMEKAFDADIITMGGGGDFPRNVMCSPLTGTEKEEYFDVLPYAQTAANYLMTFVDAPKMPRKLKVGFSNSPKNLTHVTFRDLGFAANADGTFDVYSAGGLGNNAKFGVKMAEGVDPSRILYYIKAMWLTFTTYGDYQNRGRARTRYMQEILGSAEEYKAAYLAKLQEVLDSGEDLTIEVGKIDYKKAGDGEISGKRIIAQKQHGLYTVVWHPIGGQPEMKSLCDLSKTIADMDEVEMRIAPDETAYIINLTAKEAEKVIAATPDSAQSLFETSVSCIGATTCQVGLRDSQGLLKACVEAVRAAKIADGVLPQIHISGCPSSCGTHQIGAIGFRGASKRVDDKPVSAFMLYVHGCDTQGEEAMGEELGAIEEAKIPDFLVELAHTIELTGLSYEEWAKRFPDSIKKVARQYI